MMNDSFLAYVAGLFDADGFVGLYQLDKYAYVKVAVVNKHYPVLFKMKEYFGYGSLLKSKRRKKIEIKDKVYIDTTWRYLISNKFDVIDFLKKIYPYLIVKKDRVREVLNYYNVDFSDCADGNNWAYCAGYFDGDGSLYVGVGKNGRKTASGSKLYRNINVLFYAYDRLVIDYIYSTIGYGKIQLLPTNVWCLSIRRLCDVEKVLSKLLPFLEVKKDRAEIVLRLVRNEIDIFEAISLMKNLEMKNDGDEIKYQAVRSGERNSYAKFTNEEARMIKQMFQEGKSYKELAELWGCSKHTIWRIVTGRHYISI